MKICKEGWPFIYGCLIAALLFCGAATLLGSVTLAFLSGVGTLSAAFCAYFFRDPPRLIPTPGKYVLSPADGKIVDISEGSDPSWQEPVWVMRIFLSVFEPHLQRAPLQGKVKVITYKKGRFLDARDPQAHFENEQNRIEIHPANPKIPGPIVVTQIAGLIARRIVCWVKEEQDVQAGEQIGLIRFGSQVDMVIPKSAKMRVKTGEHVTAGDTIIAEMPNV
jgi:phosphatidylserine decarboxylase